VHRVLLLPKPALVARHATKAKPAAIAVLRGTKYATRARVVPVTGDAHPHTIYYAAGLHALEPMGISSCSL
jgi:hypothetical protein